MKKILFIGNSFTGHIMDAFVRMVDNFAEDPFFIDHAWEGGATLERQLDNGRAQAVLLKEKWDVVVLQEQSQTPAIPGPPETSFQNSVTRLSKMIRKTGAEPILYETWGHQHGDRENHDLHPDFDSMQRALSLAYQKAGQTNGIRVIPVGQIWKKVHDTTPGLFARLYENDAYHPSPLGQFLNAGIFFHLLLEQRIATVRPPADLDQSDGQEILGFLANLPQFS